MKIFLAERHEDEVGYDEYDGFVVAAKDEAHALTLIDEANGNSEIEGDPGWKLSQEGTTRNRAGIILSSFKAG
jgi:hypothetical protein